MAPENCPALEFVTVDLSQIRYAGIEAAGDVVEVLLGRILDGPVLHIDAHVYMTAHSLGLTLVVKRTPPLSRVRIGAVDAEPLT